MSNKIVDCTGLASILHSYIDKEINIKQLKPHFATILVGNNSASRLYVSNKQKTSDLLGIKNTIYTLPEDTTKEYLIDFINQLNNNNSIHGILLQLPLPKHLPSKEIIGHIAIHKDIDGLHYANIGKLITEKNNGDPLKQQLYSGFAPATPMGCMFVLNSLGIKVEGQNCSVIGRSNLVGMPMFNILNNNNATVTLLHKNSNNLQHYTKNSSVLVVAAGSPNLINSSFVSPNAVVLDVGINFIKGRITGDCNTKDLTKLVKHITPVPNGIGKLTVGCMLVNVVKACYVYG